ncbi:copper-transporting ATPase HMA4-like protein [Tanacetum coccineum]
MVLVKPRLPWCQREVMWSFSNQVGSYKLLVSWLEVIGGTVNENGCLLIKATHVGSKNALLQIVQMIEAAQLACAPVQKQADRISKFFVVVAAVVTFLGWFVPGVAGIYPKSWIPKAIDEFEHALQFGISVLVVACPCALGLATPTAVMVALGKGASQGDGKSPSPETVNHRHQRRSDGASDLRALKQTVAGLPSPMTVIYRLR